MVLGSKKANAYTAQDRESDSKTLVMLVCGGEPCDEACHANAARQKLIFWHIQ